MIRVLQSVDLFKGVDGIDYGPFKGEDVVMLPKIHAAGLISKGMAVEVRERGIGEEIKEGCNKVGLKPNLDNLDYGIKASPQRAKCNSAGDVVNCIDQHLTEIPTPILQGFLSSHNWPYVTVLSQLQERGWKLDITTRTMHKGRAEA